MFKQFFSSEAGSWIWILVMILWMGMVFVLSRLLRKFLNRLEKKAKPEGVGNGWGKKFKQMTQFPLQMALWGFGVAYVFDFLGTHFDFPALIHYMHPLKFAIVVICLTWMLWQWNEFIFHRLAGKSRQVGLTKNTLFLFEKVISGIIAAVMAFTLLHLFGISLGPFLTFGGIGAAGLAFASQDVVANFFGGTMLHMTRIFAVGDYILIPSQGNFEGQIKEINWYTTTVEDKEGRIVYFPNTLFTKTVVINDSRRVYRKLRETVVLRSHDITEVKQLIETLKEKIRAYPAVDPTQAVSVTLNKFTEQGAEIYIYLVLPKMSYLLFLQTQQEILFLIHEVVAHSRAELAFSK